MNSEAKRLLTTTAISALLGFLAVTGCQSPDAAAEAEADGSRRAATIPMAGQSFPSDFDPCAFVSRQEAAEASGEGVGTPEPEIHAVMASCMYPSEEGIMPAVIVEIRPDESAYEMAVDIAQSGPEPIEELDGIGDRAFYSTLMGHNIVLVAGGRYAQVVVRRDQDADNKEKALDLARRVAGRL